MKMLTNSEFCDPKKVDAFELELRSAPPAEVAELRAGIKKDEWPLMLTKSGHTKYVRCLPGDTKWTQLVKAGWKPITKGEAKKRREKAEAEAKAKKAS